MKIDGFSFSAVAAGVRYRERLDLGMIYADVPCVTAGVFTSSQVKAAPVLLDMERLQRNAQAQCILVNSGNANACNGETGMEAALATGKLAADFLGIDQEKVLVSSTGVIGEPLNVGAFERSMSRLVEGLSPDGFDDVAHAIMTTDTVPKTASRTVELDGVSVNLLGMAKGSGMIMPNMATMLSFICTDVAIDPASLQQVLRLGSRRTFNRVTVDGETSTNDMALIMANGRAGNTCISSIDNKAGQLFAAALEDLLKELALMIARDGEGATKAVTVRVEGAASNDEAEILARAVANSPLVKTAFFGEDANWGRILVALGKAGVEFDPSDVDLFFGKVQMVKAGQGLGLEAEEAATAILREKEFTVTVRMGQGCGESEIYTCDFSLEYVKINADYRS